MSLSVKSPNSHQPVTAPHNDADNTNRNAQTRKYYIDLARKYNVPARYSLCTHNHALYKS